MVLGMPSTGIILNSPRISKDLKREVKKKTVDEDIMHSALKKEKVDMFTVYFTQSQLCLIKETS